MQALAIFTDELKFDRSLAKTAREKGKRGVAQAGRLLQKGFRANIDATPAGGRETSRAGTEVRVKASGGRKAYTRGKPKKKG